MTDDRRELINLRVSMALVAQAAGVSLEAIACDDDASYAALHHAASVRERGWNRLAGQTADAVANGHYLRG